jgi:hypothetical protein
MAQTPSSMIKLFTNANPAIMDSRLPTLSKSVLKRKSTLSIQPESSKVTKTLEITENLVPDEPERLPSDSEWYKKNFKQYLEEHPSLHNMKDQKLKAEIRAQYAELKKEYDFQMRLYTRHPDNQEKIKAKKQAEERAKQNRKRGTKPALQVPKTNTLNAEFLFELCISMEKSLQNQRDQNEAHINLVKEYYNKVFEENEKQSVNYNGNVQHEEEEEANQLEEEEVEQQDQLEEEEDQNGFNEEEEETH